MLSPLLFRVCLARDGSPPDRKSNREIDSDRDAARAIHLVIPVIVARGNYYRWYIYIVYRIRLSAIRWLDNLLAQWQI